MCFMTSFSNDLTADLTAGMNSNPNSVPRDPKDQDNAILVGCYMR